MIANSNYSVKSTLCFPMNSCYISFIGEDESLLVDYSSLCSNLKNSFGFDNVMSSCDDFLSTGFSNYKYSTEIDYGVTLCAVLAETISNKISSLQICVEVFSKLVAFVKSTTKSECKVIVLQLRSDCVDLLNYGMEHFADKLMLECPNLQNTVLIYSTSKVLTRFIN